jgi:hypothetical protein
MWGVSAPSNRYAPALFWTLAAVLASQALRLQDMQGRPRRAAAWVLTALAASPLLVEPALLAAHDNVPLGRAIVMHFGGIAVARAPAVGHDDIALVPFRTASGLLLNTPAKTQTLPAGLPTACWDAPLPCTPNPASNLELRQPDLLAKGFRVRGAWQMRDWPYYWRPGFLAEWQRRQGISGFPRQRPE